MKRLMYSGAGLLLIALAFLAFNMLAGLTLTNARVDLTEQKLYTISDGTRKILGEIDEPINLYFFYSDKTAKDLVVLRNYARRVEEMLKAYERAAGGKIKLHIVDPEPFSEAEDKAAEFGLQAVPLQQGVTRSTSVWPVPTAWTIPRSSRSSRWIRKSSSNTRSAAWCRAWPSRNARWWV